MSSTTSTTSPTTSPPTHPPTLTCLCGSISLPSSLVLYPAPGGQTSHCHCTTCRLTSGSLGLSFPLLRSAPPKDVLDKCTAYKSSEKVTRYFCGRCGGKTFFGNRGGEKAGEGENEGGKEEWYCVAGMIDRGNREGEEGERDKEWMKEVLKVDEQIFMEDTIDGGLSPLFTNTTTTPSPPTSTNTVTAPKLNPAPTSTALPATEEKAPLLLEAQCHCGGVRLLLKRANSTPQDLINGRTVSKTNPLKYPAYMCACRSCRLSVGTTLVPWVTLPLTSLLQHDSSPFPNPPTPENATTTNSTLQFYKSSETVWRTFCGKCGASVGYWNSKREEEVDLLVGLLRAEEGSLGREWLEWEGGVCSFEEECGDEVALGRWKDGGRWEGVMVH